MKFYLGTHHPHWLADARCADDCPRVRGQVGLTFDGTRRPVRWTQTEVCDG